MLQTNKHTRYKKLTKLQNTISRKNHGIIKSKLQKHKKTKLQTGGFIGLDYIKLKWKIRKFNKVIAKMNAWDKLMKVDAESYELSVKEFEDQAQAMARHYTEFTETYRQQIIFKIFEKDSKEAPKAMEAIRIKIDDSKKQLDTRMLELEKRINALNKIVDREVPEFTRLTKAFEKKTKKFQKIATHFSELSGFQEKIKELRRAYDLVSGSRDIKEVGEAHRKKKAKYEKYKADYNRILELTDQEMQNRTEVKNKIETLLETAEHYKSQFGFYEGNKRVKMGKLGLDFKSLKCEKNKSKLCMWADYYSKFADNLIDVSNRCGSIDGALGNIIQQLEICVKNLNVVFTDYEKPPEAVAVLKVFNDITSIKKETFAKISSNITELKREFYKQTPSARIMIDYNYLTFAFNYLREKLRVYRDLFNEALKNKEAMMQQQKGGAHGRPTGHPTGKPQHHSICKTFIAHPLTYENFYENPKYAQIEKLDKKFQDLHKDLGNPKNKDCYKDAAEFEKLFNIYKQYWLFANHVALNLSQIDNTSTQYAQCRKNLEIFKEIAHYLSPTITTYPWVPDLQEYIANLFKTINHPKNFGLHIKDFNEIKDKTLDDIITNAHAFTSGTTYTHVADLVNHAMQNKSNFVGFEDWDSTQKSGNFKGVYRLLNQHAGYNPNQAAQPAAAATSAPQKVPLQPSSLKIKYLIDKLKTMQATLENNYNAYMSANEYEALIKEYLDVLKLHDDDKIQFFDENIKNLVNELESFFNGNSLLNRTQISDFSTQIRLYNVKLQKLLNMYAEVKNRGYTDNDAKEAVKKAIEEYEKQMSLGLDYYITSILSNYPDQTKLPKPVIQQPQQPPQGQQDKGTSTVMEQEAKKEIERENLDIKYIPHVLKRVKQISNDRKAKGDNFYEEQFSNLTNAFEKIKALFVDIVNSEGPTSIKAISDKLQTMTLLLLDLKYIEPTVTGVKVAGYKPTMLPGADWIVKTVDKDFDKEHKLTGTSELQELIKSNRDLAQIYRKITIVDDGALNKLFEDLLFELNPHKLMTVIRSKPEYLSYLGNIDNLKRLIEIIKGRIPVSPDNDKKKRVCGILATLENLVGSLDKDKIKVIADAKLHYDSGNPNNPCVIKDEKKKDDKKDQQKQGQQQQQGKRQGL